MGIINLFIMAVLTIANSNNYDWKSILPSDEVKSIEANCRDYLFFNSNKVAQGLNKNLQPSDRFSYHRGEISGAKNGFCSTFYSRLGLDYETSELFPLLDEDVGSLNLFLGLQAGVKVHKYSPKPIFEKDPVNVKFLDKIFSQTDVPNGLDQFFKDKHEYVLCPGDDATHFDRNRFCGFKRIVYSALGIPSDSVDAINTLEKDDVVTYRVSGALEVGAGGGFPVSVFSAGGSVRVFLVGEFEIGIKRDSEKNVLVSVAYLKSKGIGGGVSGRISLDGVIVDEVDDLVKIVPFELSFKRSESKELKVVYQYDLSRMSAQTAFNQALYGKLKKTEELAKVRNSGVEFHSSLKSGREAFKLNRGYRLTNFYRSQKGSKLEYVETLAKRNDGSETKSFQAIAESSNDFKKIKSNVGRALMGFRVTSQFEKWSEAVKNLNLSFYTEFESTNMKARIGKQYIRYIGKMIPRQDINDWMVNELSELNRGEYANMKGVLQFDSWHVNQMLETIKKEKWDLMERAFMKKEKGVWGNAVKRTGYRIVFSPATILNLPLFLSGLHIRNGSDIWAAESIINRSKQLRKESDEKQFLLKLGRFFHRSFYTFETYNTLSMSNNQADVYFTFESRTGRGHSLEREGFITIDNDGDF